jgi:hypothetical protein
VDVDGNEFGEMNQALCVEKAVRFKVVQERKIKVK